ncbi:bifunctional DNA primase/polymerase [Jeotgalibaca sp. MA1X17-3]|uniref:bifunctional DNA primase/polymerase n=1 Tax=Jeotgalibaca sp. MA1X17-3 TaxID=2908211 RepID=UPI001F3BA667|nr:bifunctional DNA primase/polymerase [Jeotgalibaca sp. MA1X17-3]UJF15007.1 bifunctional DNA primase/polymerase [Jeotgalibaca sp. MA1X17-3]
MESLLNEALEYASYGFKVFPLAPLSKIPLKNTQGFKDATTDHETIFKMFTENKHANIGISFVDSPIFVVDVDNHQSDHQGIKSFDNLCGYEPLPKDVTVVKTVNGGYHVFFKAPAGVEIKQKIGFRPSVDIIKNFVVAPKSKIQRKDGSIGMYELKVGSLNDIKEVPPVLLKALTTNEQPKYKNSRQGQNYSSNDGEKKYTAIYLEKVIQGVEEGGRNDWLTNIIGTPLAQNMDVNLTYEFIHIVNQNFVRPPLHDDEVNKIFQSILRREQQKGGAD